MSARDIASRRLGRHAAAFPNFDLSPLDTGDLPQRDAALAHAIVDAAVRWWPALEFLLERGAARPVADIEPGLRGVLMAGAAQLLLLDRIPAHAAINESVESAKRLVRAGAGGLVNAVLRKLAALTGPVIDRPDEWALRRDVVPLSDGRARALTAEVFPADRWSRVAMMTGHPRWLIERWDRAFGPGPAGATALHSLANAPTFLNTAFAAAPLPSVLAPHVVPGTSVFTGSRSELLGMLGSRGDLWVQDPASAAAVSLAREIPPPTLIVDLCAGQGTKTRQLAAAFPNAAVIATEVDGARMVQLRELWRGHRRVSVLTPGETIAEARARAGLVLLDVPCSNTGVLARRVEAKHRCGPEQIARLVTLQRQIIDSAVPLLAPGGRLLYSTCSIEPEENSAQVAWAVGNLPLAVERESITHPAGAPGGPAAEYHDGAFAALLACR